MSYKKVLQLARAMRKNPTPAEAFFWEKVRKQKFMNCKFRRQHIIEHSNILGKAYFYIPDFYCHPLRLIIELDGEIHLSQVEYDKIREDILKEMGYKIIRFTNEAVLKNWSEVSLVLGKYIERIRSEEMV